MNFLGNADISDAHPDATAVCNMQFRSFGQRTRFSGPCLTLRVDEDHRPVDALVSQPGADRVLVVDALGSLRVGVLGDRLAALAARNGWAGVVIHGAIRDSRAIDEIDIGVKALGTTALRGREPRPSETGAPVTFGGVRFESGDWVYCDEDSVLVGPPNLAAPQED